MRSTKMASTARLRSGAIFMTSGPRSMPFTMALRRGLSAALLFSTRRLCRNEEETARGLSVKAKQAFFVMLCCLPLVVAAQAPDVIPLASEPHHHLALHNEYVNVYRVEVAPHDSVLLHRHDADAISVTMSDAQVTVRTPGKPDVRQRLADGQLRLQARGYVHSTSIDGDTTYRNVTVELLLPQQGARNLCAPVIAASPLNCPSAPPPPTETHRDQPQFET